MYLLANLFATVVKHTPLVSIDLIVRNAVGDVLLGKRKHRPAQGFWFVPGGRIQKDEAINAAFSRLTSEELGTAVDINLALFLGVYEHFYDDNFSNKDFSTHYIVLGYELILVEERSFPNEQHEEYCWLSPSELLASSEVHANTKAYFSDCLA